MIFHVFKLRSEVPYFTFNLTLHRISILKFLIRKRHFTKICNIFSTNTSRIIWLSTHKTVCTKCMQINGKYFIAILFSPVCFSTTWMEIMPLSCLALLNSLSSCFSQLPSPELVHTTPYRPLATPTLNPNLSNVDCIIFIQPIFLWKRWKLFSMPRCLNAIKPISPCACPVSSLPWMTFSRAGLNHPSALI